MACSPDQGNYISVTKSLPQNASVINEAGAPLVTGVEFRVGKNFIYGVYDSCKVREKSRLTEIAPFSAFYRKGTINHSSLPCTASLISIIGGMVFL